MTLRCKTVYISRALKSNYVKFNYRNVKTVEKRNKLESRGFRL